MLYRPGLLGRLPCPMDWYAGSGPPTVSDDFTGPVSLPAGWTFTRSSANATNCLYTDSVTAPAFTTYAANAPRFLDFGLLMEPQRINLFLNSDAPVNQSITLALGYYCIYVMGPPSSQVAVGQTGGVLAGGNMLVNTNNINMAQFQVTTAGSFSFTVSGTPTRVQVEAGTSPTSYIASTATAQTRTEDRLNKVYSAGVLNIAQGTYWVEYIANGLQSLLTTLMSAGLTASYSGAGDSNVDRITLNPQTTNNQVTVLTRNSSSIVGQTTLPVGKAMGAVSRVAMSASINSLNGAIDYSLGTVVDPNYRPSSKSAVMLGGGGSGAFFNGFIRGFKYWPVALPDAELKECTGTDYYPQGPVFTFDFTTGVFPRRVTLTRNSVGTYFDAAGVLQTATANVPRFDYDPVTHALRGLLIEEQRQNVIFQSGDFTNAVWAKANCTTAAGVAGPNGAATGSGLISNAGVIGYFAQTTGVSVTAGTTYTTSVFMKAGTASSAVILLPSTWWIDAVFRIATFNLATGTVTSVTGNGATGAIVPVGNGWYRTSITATPDTSVVAGAQFARAVANGDGVSVQHYAFGAQFEAGAFATSYIPTTTVAVTRAADQCSMTGTNFSSWWNQPNGTYKSEFMLAAPCASGSQAGAIRVDDGTGNTMVDLFINSTQQAFVFSTIGGVIQINTATPGALATNSVIKEAIAYTTNVPSWQGAANGVTLPASGNIVAATQTRMLIGSTSSGGNTFMLNGWMRNVQYWPRALTNAELQQATT